MAHKPNCPCHLCTPGALQRILDKVRITERGPLLFLWVNGRIECTVEKEDV